jgi:nicotinate-nucleotide--dimethylbenzimidazole phosphoribosyltransferase
VTASAAFTHAELREIVNLIGPSDSNARARAARRQDSLTKPPGSLGVLEELSLQFAAASGCERPVTRPRTLILAAADHGVTAEGVSAYPSEVTAQMVANFVAGGAAANVLARQAGVDVVVLDVGIAATLAPAESLVNRKVRQGTKNLADGPAMTEGEALAALHAGIDTALTAIDAGARILLTGDMGIGNTTAASAVTAALLGLPPAEVTGRGTGLDDERLGHKVAVIERALARCGSQKPSPLGALTEFGGLEMAALTGVIIAGASRRTIVVVDGFVSGAAALVAARLASETLPYVVAGHRSVEPGHGRILEALGLQPLLDLQMRLGEGTGALLAIHLVDAAAGILNEMSTFTEAGVTDRGPLD